MEFLGDYPGQALAIGVAAVPADSLGRLKDLYLLGDQDREGRRRVRGIWRGEV